MNADHSREAQVTGADQIYQMPRILIIDDNPEIHRDFKTILIRDEGSSLLADLEKELFDDVSTPQVCEDSRDYDVDYALQGEEGVDKAYKARSQGSPFMVAFVDMRMPPGWDGLETIEHIWEADPEIQVVICTAYSDYSWEEITQRLGRSDKLLLLKKPFDVAEIAQLTSTLVHKWILHRQATSKMADLESIVEARTRELVQANENLLQEVHERKQIEQALRESEHFLTRAQKIACIGHWKLNPETKEISGSDELFRIFGLSRDKATLEALIETVHPDDRGHDLYHIKRGMEFEEPWDTEYRLVAKDGTEKWVHAIGDAMEDETGKPVMLMGTVQDITAHKHAEDALRDSEERFRELADLLPQSVFETDLAGNFTYSNSYSFQANGYTPEDLDKGVNALEMFPPEQRERVVANIQNVLTGMYFDDHEYTIVRKDGTTFPALLYTSPIIRDGQPVGLRGIVLDITDLKQAEEELQNLAMIVKYSNELVNLADLDGKMVFLNEAGGKMLGIDPEEVEQVNIMEVIPAHLKELVRNELLPALMNRGNWEGDLQYCNLKTGELTDVHAMSFMIHNQNTGEPLYLANVSLDITDRKQAEESLKKKLGELERYKKVTINRELRMKELKGRIKELEGKSEHDR